MNNSLKIQFCEFHISSSWNYYTIELVLNNRRREIQWHRGKLGGGGFDIYDFDHKIEDYVVVLNIII